jgi:hypothetical protein
VDTLGNLLEQALGNIIVGWVLREVYGNQELLSLSVDIANIDTTLVGEVDPIALQGTRMLATNTSNYGFAVRGNLQIRLTAGAPGFSEPRRWEMSIEKCRSAGDAES